MSEIREVESKQIDERIQSICLGYLDFLAKCAKDRQLRDDFMSNPKSHLKSIGMNIPDGNNVKVVLDTSVVRWPVVYIRSKDNSEHFVVKEGKLSLTVEEFDNPGVSHGETLKTKHQAELQEEIKGSVENYDVVIRFPFFDAWSDDLGEIKFNDTAIILSSC
jgi:hypothetical protein